MHGHTFNQRASSTIRRVLDWASSIPPIPQVLHIALDWATSIPPIPQVLHIALDWASSIPPIPQVLHIVLDWATSIPPIPQVLHIALDWASSIPPIPHWAWQMWWQPLQGESAVTSFLYIAAVLAVYSFNSCMRENAWKYIIV